MTTLPGKRHRDKVHYRESTDWRVLTPIVYSALLLFCFACTPQTEGNQEQKTAAPVAIASVTRKDVPVQIRAIGNVESYASVAIKSMVNGQVTKTAFKEGQHVKKGDLLLVVDPRPFEAALNQAEAILEKDLSQVREAQANRVSNESHLKHAEAILKKDQIQAKNARVQAERYGALVAKGNVSKDQYDQVQTNADALNAVVLADQAALEEAHAALRASEAARHQYGGGGQCHQGDLKHPSVSHSGLCHHRCPL